MKRIGLLFLFVTLCIASAQAASPNWIAVNSPHFSVMTDGGAKQALHLADQFERMRAVFHTLFPKMDVDPPSPILVIAVKNMKGFQELEPTVYLAKGQLKLAGLFLRTPDENYILMRLDAEDEKHPYTTIYHEYTHFMVRKSAAWLPLWTNEGLAEFFQNTDIHDKTVDLGEASEDNILYLRQNRLLPLPVVFQVDHNSPYYHNEQKGSVFYAESWALIHYLEITDHQHHTGRLQTYLQLVSQHQDPVTAAQSAFGDLTQLQKQLESYIHQGSFMQFRMATPPVMDPASFQQVSLTLLQADARRADFLAHNDRAIDARKLLDTILQQDPKNVSAYETMGYLGLQDHDETSAKKWLSQAVALDSQSYLANFYFATMSINAGGIKDAAAVESSLKKCIKLNPDFAPAYDRLAVLYAMQHEHLDDAHILELQAMQLEPEKIAYRINLAQVFVALNRTDDALRVLHIAAPLAKTSEERDQLEHRTQAIERYSEEKQAAQSENKASVTVVTTEAPAKGESATNPAVLDVPTPKHPDKALPGPKHEAKGVIESVRCGAPAVLELHLKETSKTSVFYTNNYFHVGFLAANYTPKDEIHPCADIEGKKARVLYAETTDKTVAGQIVSIELSR